ncbi:hypothetical protein K457DRAFT_131430 [Linnemannia elongata AG-77]|uniref:Uncharacterized protein n=1 Tax=Linnemannia elongata AG-77 TaxID=1314771 RepID=A0A197JAR4_9FUNG|nr:hypothetical protein K457DRAFT_131430 [Linnemannia elongata AG-77]
MKGRLEVKKSKSISVITSILKDLMDISIDIVGKMDLKKKMKKKEEEEEEKEEVEEEKEEEECTVEKCVLDKAPEGAIILGRPRGKGLSHKDEFYAKKLTLWVLGVEATFLRDKKGRRDLRCICGEGFRFGSQLARHVMFEPDSRRLLCSTLHEKVVWMWESSETIYQWDTELCRHNVKNEVFLEVL